MIEKQLCIKRQTTLLCLAHTRLAETPIHCHASNQECGWAMTKDSVPSHADATTSDGWTRPPLTTTFHGKTKTMSQYYCGFDPALALARLFLLAQ
jgi:hypothetical protein